MTSHSSESERDADDVARRLEAIHRKVAGSIRQCEHKNNDEIEDSGESTSDIEELRSAEALFQLIEDVRTNNEAATTGDNHTTALVEDDTAVQPTHGSVARHLPVRTELAHGHRLGKFLIERKLGEGGYGYVFLALDEELDRHVALKIPRPETILTEETKLRFLREGKAAALLSHPNIVPVFETGHEGPICFIVCRYVDGITLADWLTDQRDHQVEPHLAAKMTVTIADGLQHAHNKGVIHRDLKPANILLEGFHRRSSPDQTALNPSPPEDNDQRDLSLARATRIADFGLAKNQADNDVLTGTGAVIGTPAYMSPEQARGATTSASSDVYSLGAVLYEMLTGTPPHSGDSILETLRSVHEIEPRAPRRRNSNIPKDLNAICLKCLEKEPTRRYDTAHALKVDLQRFLEGQPIHARTASWPERLWLMCRRKPTFAAALAALAISLIVGSTLFGIQYRRTIEANRDLHTTIELLAQVFGRAHPGEYGRDVTVASQLDRGLQQIRSDASLSSDARGSIAFAIGKAYLGLGLYQESIGSLNFAGQQWADKHDADSEIVLKTKTQLGLAYSKAGMFATAMDVLRPNADLASATLGEEHDITKNAKHCLAITHGAMGNHQRELTILESLYASPRGESSPDEEVQILNNYALALSKAGRLEEAVPLFLQARRIFSADDFRTLEVDRNLSVTYLKLNRHEEAADVIERALPICRKVLGEIHPQTFALENNLAGLLMTQGQFEEAVELLERLLPTTQQMMGENHPDTLSFEVNLGGGYLRTDQPEKAVDRFAVTLRKLRTHFGESYPLTAKCYGLLGQAKTAAGRHSEAVEIFRELIESEQAEPQPNNVRLAQLHWRLGIALEKDDCPDESAAIFENSIRLFRIHAPERWQVADVESRLGELLWKKGDLASGQAMLKDGYDLLVERTDLMESGIRDSVVRAAKQRLALSESE